MSLAAGAIWEVDEEVAKVRIKPGLAEAIEEPEGAVERPHVQRGGKTAEVAVDKKTEKR